jgi:hypothetical protein
MLGLVRGSAELGLPAAEARLKGNLNSRPMAGALRTTSVPSIGLQFHA